MGAIFAGVESRAISRTILFRNLEGFTPNSRRTNLKLYEVCNTGLKLRANGLFTRRSSISSLWIEQRKQYYDFDESIKYVAHRHKQCILMYTWTSDKLAIYGHVNFNSKTQAHRHCKCPKKKNRNCAHIWRQLTWRNQLKYTNSHFLHILLTWSKGRPDKSESQLKIRLPS